ncbi:hypothetical protein MRO55_25980, partial [Escherichia coli]|nr:hypothetical protein [Escherichia coli]
GVIVLLLPRESAGVIAVIAGLWALALGTLTVFGALTLRRLGGPLWWGLLLVGGLGRRRTRPAVRSGGRDRVGALARRRVPHP